ncbi:MAG TPA: ROK family protein [Acidiferrobacter sp.]|nr:ROK family protein [Acidiferrobacter sp.]
MAAQSQTILVIDVGGSHIKCLASDRETPISFPSGPQLTAGQMVREVLRRTADWRFDVVSVGFPGVVRDGRIAREPHNLGSGWVDFDWTEAFRRPVKLINDAAMQALGDYEGGKMLFLGLGTGLGSALIVDGLVVPMELGHLPAGDGRVYEDDLGDQGRKRLGKKKWRRQVRDVVEGFRAALLPDDIVLGGGGAAHLKELPPQTRRGGNARAFPGGFSLWEPGYSGLKGQANK